MNKFKKKLLAAISTGVMLFGLAGPVLADTTIEISGNGASSDNTAAVKTTGDTTVVQNNSATISNSVTSSASTGENKANQNTGGDVVVSTGDATSQAVVDNQVNSNSARVDCCNSRDTDVLISGNGADSDNKVKLKDDSDISVYQDNTAKVSNYVEAEAETGENKANQNTGGDVLITTGNADASAHVSTAANANWALVGGDGHTGSLSARILGNGFRSDNNIHLNLDDDTTLVQSNDAYVYNYVKAEAETGENKANQNTGGDVLIVTGDAQSDVTVDNLVNFNWADIDCGCTLDLLAKVAGNGADSDNKIKAKLDNDREVFQDNLAYLDNYVEGEAETGDNHAKQNTGPVGDDPTTIWTGDSESSTWVSNTGNANSYGASWPVEWPDFDFSFNFSLSLSQLLALVH